MSKKVVYLSCRCDDWKLSNPTYTNRKVFKCNPPYLSGLCLLYAVVKPCSLVVKEFPELRHLSNSKIPY